MYHVTFGISGILIQVLTAGGNKGQREQSPVNSCILKQAGRNTLWEGHLCGKWCASVEGNLEQVVNAEHKAACSEVHALSVSSESSGNY